MSVEARPQRCCTYSKCCHISATHHPAHTLSDHKPVSHTFSHPFTAADFCKAAIFSLLTACTHFVYRGIASVQHLALFNIGLNMSHQKIGAVRKPRLATNVFSLHHHKLLCASLLGILITTATPGHSAVKATAYSEFVKALNIVEQTQLTLFTDTPPPAKNDIIADYNARIKEIESSLDKDTEDAKATLEKKRIETMRLVLAETIDAYNDQYANYISPDALKKYNSRRNGNFVGVGLKFRALTDDYPVAIGALIGGPMDGKNVKPGDKLISVDDKSLKALQSRDVVAALKGPKDSTAVIKVSREGREHTINVKRAAVTLHYADSRLIDQSIGYIKISRFGSKTHERVGGLLDELIQQGASSFILDLRDNPGGSTRAARAIVSMFSTENDVYCERYKTGAVKQLPRHGNHVTDLPLAVLINGDSMSSSEIVAGAIQSYNRGVIVGTPSFGKGLVQKVFNLSAPLGGAIRTTIAVFGRPDHQLIHATGIVPDFYVKTDSDFMYRRVGSLNIADDAKAFQRTLLEKDVREKHPEKADALIAAKDLQLQTAINKLQQLADNAQ